MATRKKQYIDVVNDLHEALVEWSKARRAWLRWQEVTQGAWPSTMLPAARNRFEFEDTRITARYEAAEHRLARAADRHRREKSKFLKKHGT